MLLRHPIIIVTQHMNEPQLLEQMGFLTARSFDQALEMAFAIRGDAASVAVIPDGVSVIVRKHKEVGNE